MSCYICDHHRLRPESKAMPDDQWGEGCEDCFSAFVDAFILPHAGDPYPKSEAADTSQRAVRGG